MFNEIISKFGGKTIMGQVHEQY